MIHVKVAGEITGGSKNKDNKFKTKVSTKKKFKTYITNIFN